jgi:hypothetical protein
MARRARVLAVLGVLGSTAGACHRTPPVVAADVPCAPVERSLAAGSHADGMAGDFRLTLVATRGTHTGQSVSGRLRLRAVGPQPAPVDPATSVRYPLYGSAVIALDSVGATPSGDIGAMDAARPGVLVIESSTDIVVRFGADGNSRTAQAFDGAYMALFVTALSPTRFAGRWNSGRGAVPSQESGGHFCAEFILG